MTDSDKNGGVDSGGKKVVRETFEVTTDDGIRIVGSEKYLPASEPRGTVILLHPMVALGHLYWDIPFKDYSFMDYLACHNFRAVGMDFRGLGESDKPDLVTFEECSKDIEAVMAHIKKKYGLSKVHVIATSFGAMVVTFFIPDHQNSIDRLVLSDYMYKQIPGGPMVERMKELLDKGKRYVRDKPSLEPGPELYDPEPELMAVWSKLIEEKNPSRPISTFVDTEGRMKSAENIPQIRVPTLLVRGDHDLNTQDGTLQCFQELGSEEKAFLEIGNIGHSLWRERKHRVVFRLLLGWISG